MTITVTDVITEAYYDSSVVARQFETIQGYQLNDGLKWLNQLLGDKATDSGDIPYITQQYPLYGIVGQETYFVPGLIDIEAMVFYVGSVRYQMQYVDRIRYFGQPRANNINALPVSYTYERVFGGCNVWVYFWPQQPYLFNITGNFFMPTVSLNQDLTQPIANANLGQVNTIGTGTLATNQFLVNGVDLAGAYGTAQPAANLAAAINSGVPNVSATVTGNSVLSIASTVNGQNILLSSSGVSNAPNYLTFSYFNTIGGVALNQTYFSQALDQFYIDYLEYQLAERICQKLNFEVPSGVANQLARYQLQISKMAEPLDLVCQKVSTLSGNRAINYAAVSLGKGWTTSGM